MRGRPRVQTRAPDPRGEGGGGAQGLTPPCPRSSLGAGEGEGPARGGGGRWQGQHEGGQLPGAKGEEEADPGGQKVVSPGPPGRRRQDSRTEFRRLRHRLLLCPQRPRSELMVVGPTLSARDPGRAAAVLTQVRPGDPRRRRPQQETQLAGRPQIKCSEGRADRVLPLLRLCGSSPAV